MKSIISLALFLSTSTAFASSITIPPTAKVLYQAAGSNEAELVMTAESARAQAIDSAMKNIQSKQDENDVEYACKGVYHQWSRVSVVQMADWGNYHSFMGNVSVSVYCDPRAFSEKVAISAERACEREPKPECMSPQYIELFSKIKQTAYYDINKPQN